MSLELVRMAPKITKKGPTPRKGPTSRNDYTVNITRKAGTFNSFVKSEKGAIFD